MRDFLVAIWRSASRERSYAAINLVGLALGFASCLLLALYLHSELTYDRHHANHARIYRVVAEVTSHGSSRQTVWVPRAGAPMMTYDYPQIQAFVRFTDSSLQDGLVLRYGDRVHNWRHTFFSDASVFRVFTHKILAGNAATALEAESSVAISQTMATTYFGNDNPIGKILRTESGQPWRVTLVFADLPPNTHLRYDALFADRIPLLRDAADQAGRRAQLLTGFGAYTYLLMAPGFDPAQWDKLAADFVKRYIESDAQKAGQSLRILLQPLTDIHYADPIEGDQPTGSRPYLYGCVTVALFILIVACINYTNLATARALRRAHSVGVRKILGARRSQLLLEFLGEAVLYAIAAAILGMGMAEVALTLTPIGELLGQQVHLDLSSEPAVLGWVLAAAVLVGMTAGFYPAIYLSSWMPAAAFSVRGGGVASGARLREVLVLLQFVIAVGVVAATLVMAAQMHFVANSSLGFGRDNRVMITIRGTDSFARVPALTQELLESHDVIAVTQAQVPPGRVDSTGFIRIENQQGEIQQLRTGYYEVGPHFLETMDIKLLAGRDFADDVTSRKSNEFLVNETLVRRMGWQDPIGRRINEGRVIGVVRDFHYRSLRESIAPLVLVPLNDDPATVAEARRPFVQRIVMMRLSGRDIPGTLKHIEATMARFDPTHPFEYSLLDDSLRRLYATDRQMLSLFEVFATLCIFIACLGLVSLTAFATERRAREIAIRKVLGASAWQVVLLLSRRIMLLIALGGAIAAAVAWVVMKDWLDGFAYRVDVNPLLLLLSIVGAGAVALVTVALQSLRTARADPADTLRHE